MTTLGIIGAGFIGSQVARAAIAGGYEVVIANSRGPETLAGLIAELGSMARAATAEEAAESADVALVAVPFHARAAIPAAPLAGKIVMDANNYYWERDGRIPELDRGETTTSQLMQELLAGAKVAKAFNHIRAAEITADAAPAGTPGRRALATSSDFPEAAEWVLRFYDRIGFDGVDVSPLSESWRIERDRPAYVARLTADELRERIARAPRTI